MAQTQRSKPPLDVLQSMINGILIETGRALKSSDKEGGRSFASANTRLRTTMPSAIENFHQALDELECDIIRTKAVLLRDLEELRSKRKALQNPIKVDEEHIKLDTTSTTDPPNNEFTMAQSNQAVPVKEEKAQSKSPEKQDPTEPDKARDLVEDQVQLLSSTTLEGSQSQQGPNPPSFIFEAGSSAKPIGLGINTEGIAEPTSAPETAGVPDSSVDSLFDIPDNEDNGDSEINFDSMDFSVQDTSTNTQNQEQSQTQNNDFDLSTFGNTSQDFNITDLHTSDGTMNNTHDLNNNKQVDIFDMVDNTGGTDSMDPDLDFVMAEESDFDDIFFAGRDDGNLGGGGEMQHGQFDIAFFGLDD